MAPEAARKSLLRQTSMKTVLLCKKLASHAAARIIESRQDVADVRKQQLYDMWAPPKSKGDVDGDVFSRQLYARSKGIISLLGLSKVANANSVKNEARMISGWLEVRKRGLFKVWWEMRYCELTMSGDLVVRKSQSSPVQSSTSIMDLYLVQDEKDHSVICLKTSEESSSDVIQMRIPSYKIRQDWVSCIRTWTKRGQTKSVGDIDDLAARLSKAFTVPSKRTFSLDNSLLARRQSNA
mmetsp:Transcript_32580/g.103179  ORF Transcript_32580/g.103179 Transcript_32580/m.103179 type:complete len:238 (-) Transcript_32580:130-843(-)